MASFGRAKPPTPKYQIIHQDATVFVADWFKLTVVSKSITFETSDPTMSKFLCDLASGTFKILEHTPLEAFGVNFVCALRDAVWQDFWHRLGHHFAPP